MLSHSCKYVTLKTFTYDLSITSVDTNENLSFVYIES